MDLIPAVQTLIGYGAMAAAFVLVAFLIGAYLEDIAALMQTILKRTWR
jgi:hypothetical protein